MLTIRRNDARDCATEPSNDLLRLAPLSNACQRLPSVTSLALAFVLVFAVWLMASVAATTVLAADAPVQLRKFGINVTIAAKGEESLTAGAARLGVTGTVGLDAWLVGANVKVDAKIGRDLTVRAANVSAAGDIGGSVEASGADVKIDARIGTNLDIEAAEANISPKSTVGGEVTINAAEVTYGAANVGRVDIRAREINFDGASKGAVTLSATKVIIGPNARINGDLVVFSIGEPEISPSAIITGTTTRKSLFQSETMQPFTSQWLPMEAQIALILGMSGLMAGIFFLLAGRTGLEESINTLVEHPAGSLGWGLGALVVVPVAAALLGISIVGIPLGICALLALPVLLLLGYAQAGFGLGERLFNSIGDPLSGGTRVVLLLAGLIGLGLLSLIPYAGPFIAVIAALMGVGAVLKTFHKRMR